MSPKAGWLLHDQIIPRLKSAIPGAAHCVGAEDPAELIADATAIAAELLDSTERRRKKVSSGNVSYYATRLASKTRAAARPA